MLLVAGFLWRRLVRLDGLSVRVRDEDCQAQLTAARAEIGTLRVEVAVLRERLSSHERDIARLLDQLDGDGR